MKRIRVSEADSIYNATLTLSEKAYTTINSFPREEEFGMASSIRQRVSFAVNSAADLVTASDLYDMEYALQRINKELFGLKTVYKFSQRTRVTELEEDFLDGIDKLLDDIVSELEKVQRLQEEEQKQLEAEYRSDEN